MSALNHRVRGLGARAVLLASVTAVMFALGAIGASGASAAGVCTGADIKGEGASLQGKAQSIWSSTPFVAGKGFNGNALGCTMEAGGLRKAMITYTASGSGAGLEAWGLNGGAFNNEDVFISSDDAPTTPQLEELQGTLELESGEETDLVVFPVTQTAIAVIVNLPTGCTLTSNRIRNADLEAVFRGAKTLWSEVTGASAGCANKPITRVVRKDGSGTTYQFKHYLNVLNGANVCTTKLGNVTWAELQNNSKVEVGGEKVLPNTTWPDCPGASPIVTAANNGGGALVTKVNATEGGIGYAALADAENNKAGATTVLSVQNSGLPTFASPAAAGSNAACTETEYANRPKSPAGVEFANWAEAAANPLNQNWSGVYGSNPTIGGTKYPICTLTWSIAATNSSGVFGGPATTTLMDYETYVIAAAGGQADAGGNWYAPVPANPASVSASAVAEIE